MEVTAGCAGAMNEAMSDRARGRDGESARERACVCIFAKRNESNVLQNEMKAMKVLEIVFNTHRVQTHPTYI
jgi:hypothetical protein